MNRIALIGNMNNSFFALMRYLRDEGFDAHLFYYPTHEHFLPYSDCLNFDHLEYCHDLSWINRDHFLLDRDRLESLIRGFDFYIGQGDEAAWACMVGIQFDMYFPYGSDVYKYAHLEQEYNLKQKLYLKFNRGFTWNQLKIGTFPKFQRKVIVSAKRVLMDYTNEDFDKKLKALDITGEYLNIALPFLYYPQYHGQVRWDVHWKTVIDGLRKDCEFLVLYHGRQEWNVNYKDNEFTNKNSHHLILGFHLFIKKNPKLKARLVLIEYGNCVDKTKGLIDELGIRESVLWLPKLFRKDLMYLIKQVDLCTGEFDKSYMTFGTIIEGMIMGKPVLHYREDDLYRNSYEQLYPLYNAREPHEIEKALDSAYSNPDERRRIGEEAQQWVKTFFIDQPLRKIVSIIKASHHLQYHCC